MDSERPIEKLLRACAAKRRQDAGAKLELHPVTRRLLQEEVARRYGTKVPRGSVSALGLGRFWNRLAWGLGTAAAVVIAAAVFLPHLSRDKSQSLMAKTQPNAAPAMVGSPTSALPVLAAEAAADKGPAPDSTRLATTLAGVLDSTPLPTAAVAFAPSPTSSVVVSPPSAGTATPNSAALAARFITPSAGEAQPTAPTSTVVASTAPSVAPQALGGRQGGIPEPATPTPMRPGVAPATPQLAGGQTFSARGESADVLRSRQTVVKEERAAEVSSMPRRYGPAPRSQAADAKPTAPAPQSLDQVTSMAASVVIAQQFTQVPVASKAGVKRSAPAAASAKVLNAFRLEQTGQSLRVIDHDGSVYTGSFQSAGYPLTDTVSRVDKGTSTTRYAEPPVRKAVQSRSQVVLDQPFTNSQNTLQYFFRVAGTNRSLNQRVVFTGNLINATASAQRQKVSLQNQGAGARGQQGASPVSIGLPGTQISGKVSVGGGREIEINALPAKPQP